VGDESTYLLDNAWVEARRRLKLIEDVSDPLTARALDAVGVQPGWHCLDIGAGGGSVARALCARVGPSGQVVAVDLDTRFLEELDEDNLDVHRRDVVSEGVPGGGYDLIHTRMLLMHLPARDRLLEELVAALRPGGWLVIEELDRFPIDQLAEGLYGEVWGRVLDAFDAGGVATTWARRLPALFDRAGLEDVEPTCETALFRGGSAYAELIAVSIVQLEPVLLGAGATREQLDEMAVLLGDPTHWLPAWGMVSTRGRAPQR
jgi:SAM-dependent methyltransferase